MAGSRGGGGAATQDFIVEINIFLLFVIFILEAN